MRDWRSYLQSKPGAAASYPFGPGALVFKVAGRMFALVGEGDATESLNLKCDPQDALALRAAHTAITSAYHMNKTHWNTVQLDGSLPDELIEELIDHSYDLVVARLSKAKRAQLGLAG